jgi:ribonuclease T2
LGFILHGVWPSYGYGYPSYCSNESMSDELMYEYPGVYPNDFLYDHEWGKHGTCTGLDPEEYLIMSQQLKDSIIIPTAFESPEEPFRTSVDELLEAFMQANPNFEKESFAVNCSDSGAYLTELYVCYSKDGYPSECGADVLDIASESCSQPDFLVRNVR